MPFTLPWRAQYKCKDLEERNHLTARSGLISMLVSSSHHAIRSAVHRLPLSAAT